jgi:3-oxoacyl-[acyl-carrier protein] reductase
MSATKPLALVTGGSRGIGAGICLRLAKEGFHVIVNYSSNESKARALSEQIHALGGSASIRAFDVSDSQAVEAAFSDIAKIHGPVQVLVNNAGINVDSLIIRLKDEDLDRVMNVDLKGAIYCTREAAKQMMRARKGSIIQISSVIGEMGNAGQAAYSAAKAGLLGFSKSVAKELGSRGVRVNVITPGFIATEMTESLTEDQKQAIVRNIPLGAIGLPEDIAGSVAFLASEDSRYITGQVIGVNGGMYM